MVASLPTMLALKPLSSLSRITAVLASRKEMLGVSRTPGASSRTLGDNNLKSRTRGQVETKEAVILAVVMEVVSTLTISSRLQATITSHVFFQHSVAYIDTPLNCSSQKQKTRSSQQVLCCPSLIRMKVVREPSLKYPRY